MAWTKDQKFCKRGHRLTAPDALYTFPDGRHQCRLCRLLHHEQRKGRVVILQEVSPQKGVWLKQEGQ